MVLNSSVVVSIANLSANVCQYIACNPERLPSDQVFNLLCCLPLHQFRRLALSLWTYLSEHQHHHHSDTSSSSSSSDDDDDSHSD